MNPAVRRYGEMPGGTPGLSSRRNGFHFLTEGIMQRLVTLLLVLLVSPRLAHAQDTTIQGVRFEQGLSWPAMQAKAKSANQYIFMALYTTSCKPCTWMEQNVYNLKEVGQYLNDNFIAVRVQVDTTPDDNAHVKSWQAAAQKIRQRYAVTAFPTFLFFAPDGKLVHRATGPKGADSLLVLAADAANPAKQYYTLLDNYRLGRKDPTGMRYLARTAQSLKDTALAQQVAQDYIANLSDTDLYARDNLEFVLTFTRSSRDRGFTLFYRHAAKVDSILERAGVSRSVVDGIIAREEVGLSVAAAEKGGPVPDWNQITAAIVQKYGAEYADRIVVGGKVYWYKSQKDWPNYIPCLVTQVEKYGPSKVEGLAVLWLNNSAWDVFLYSSDKAVLTKALAWSERAVKADPRVANHLDTYANLLYKLGRTEEALRWQEVATKLEPQTGEFATNLEKMKQGDPTWPQP